MAQFNIHYAGGTDTGLVRDHNEDSVLCCDFPHSEIYLMVVADGVGGHAAGEVASQLAIDTLQAVVAKAVLQSHSGGGYGENWLELTLRHALEEANSIIIQQQEAQAELKGMATTVVVALSNRRQLAVSHLGDSRCYLYAENQLTQLTRDHTVLQNLLEEGKITQREFEALPMHNLISQALGLSEAPEFEIMQYEFKEQQAFLLCSDGLTNCVSDSEILHKLNRYPDLSECVDQLITLANDNGGSDNISVVILSSDSV